LDGFEGVGEGVEGVGLGGGVGEGAGYCDGEGKVDASFGA